MTSPLSKTGSAWPWRPVLLLSLLVLFGSTGSAAQTFAGTTAAYVLLAVALELVWGQAGVLSLGHALYFGVGAYTVALFTTRVDITEFWVILPVAAVGAGAVGLLMSILLFYGRRPLPVIYVAMTSLATSYVAATVASSWSFLGSDTGIPGVGPLSVAGVDITGGFGLMLVTVGVAILIVIGLHRLLESQFRLILTGLREAETFVRSSGFRTGRIKGFVLMISSMVAGLAGAMYALNAGFVSPSSLGFELSTLAVIWVLAGGLGSLEGAVLGAIAIEYLTRFATRSLVGWWEIVIGVLLLIVVLFFEGGLLSIFDSRRVAITGMITRKRSEARQ